MKTLLLFVVGALLLAPSFHIGASGRPEASDTQDSTGVTRTVTDGLDRDVSLPEDPRRIVIAGRAVLMMADVLWAFESAPERVIGVGRISQGRGNFPAAIDPGYEERITILERRVGPEQVASLNPDVVILKSMERENLGIPLERLGIPVIYVDLESPEQYQRDLAVLGAVVNEEGRAAELAGYFRRVSAEVVDTASRIPSSDHLSTLMLYYRASGGEVAFDVPPAGWMQTRIVEMAGGTPVWKEANPGGGWATVGFEQIAAWNPDVIVMIEYGGSALEIVSRLKEEPRWQALDAVRRDRFYAMPMDYYSWDQPDVRWLLGLQWLAGVLQPRAFTELDIDARTREFFRVLYGMEDPAYEELILPVLAGSNVGAER